MRASIYLIFFLVPLISFSYEINFTKLNLNQKVELIKIYHKVFLEYEKENEKNLSENRSIFQRIQLFSQAYAEGNYECLYGGWPARKIGGLCSRPQNTNDLYKAKYSQKCGENKNSLYCNPAVFGEDLCVDISTQYLRVRAFSQCLKKFNEEAVLGKRDYSAIAKNSFENPDLEGLLKQANGLVNDICFLRKGRQGSSPMCELFIKHMEKLEADKVVTLLNERTDSNLIQEPTVSEEVSEVENVNGVGEKREEVPLEEVLANQKYYAIENGKIESITYSLPDSIEVMRDITLKNSKNGKVPELYMNVYSDQNMYINPTPISGINIAPSSYRINGALLSNRIFSNLVNFPTPEYKELLLGLDSKEPKKFKRTITNLFSMETGGKDGEKLKTYEEKRKHKT